MFIRRPKEKSLLDEAIDSALIQMDSESAGSEEYGVILERLERLNKINQSKDRLSKDTLAIVIANLAGIAIIVGHERAHVVTSKALAFILKSR